MLKHQAVQLIAILKSLTVPAKTTTVPPSLIFADQAKQYNKLNKLWFKKLGAVNITDPMDVIDLINKSPWCRVVDGDNPQHKVIAQYSSKGVLTKTPLGIHTQADHYNIGRTSLRIAKKLCQQPSDTVFGVLKVKARKGNKPAAIIFGSHVRGLVPVHSHNLSQNKARLPRKITIPTSKRDVLQMLLFAAISNAN